MRIIGKNRKLLGVLFMAIFLLSICAISGCRGSKGQRSAYKAQKEAVKEDRKEHEEILKSNYDRQSDYSKQMMRDIKKENKRIKKSKKRSLWDRLFNNKCR
jgi:predicted nuclease with TOPRIM domain